MRGQCHSAVWLLVLILLPANSKSGEPLKLHPENPRYFMFREKPALLITSGEHYGAVLNLDFDYVPYLDELKARGFNLTRLFCGTYREIPGSFGIRDNTLAPLPNRFIAPWARSDQPGYFDGGNKFDLTKWDDAFFKRLKDFASQASSRGVILNLSFFTPNYEEKLWLANPMNSNNNINGVGNVPFKESYTLKHANLLEVQIALVKKIVSELNEYDNVYYEICNEPYFGGVTLDWQAKIAATIVEAEAPLPNKHLIAQNIANGTAKIGNPNTAVSIFHFHYAHPPDAIATNRDLKKPITFDETGFRGSLEGPYRTEAWDFIIAGGSGYDNLDYSFTAKDSKGGAPISAPGTGGNTFRSQLKILKDFIEGFDFIRMEPKADLVKSGVPKGASVRVLGESGKAYALFILSGDKGPKSLESLSLEVEMPAGKYRAEWINTLSGAIDKAEEFEHTGGNKTLVSPHYSGEAALRILLSK